MKIVYKTQGIPTKPFGELRKGAIFSIPLKDQAEGSLEHPALFIKTSMEEATNAFCLTEQEEAQLGLDAACIEYDAELAVRLRS